MPGQNVVITGGSSGLGLALAHKFARDGSNVGLVARSATRLEQAVQEIRAGSPAGIVCMQSVDVTEEDPTQIAMSKLADEMDGIDVLINSAGILREGYFETLSTSTFREIMEVNVIGVVNVTKAALPYLKSSRGRIVNIASMASLSGVFGYAAYCASKHALAGLTESLYYELLPQAVRVQLICPPEFDSPMVDSLDKHRTPENRQHTLMIPKSPIHQVVESTWSAIHSDRFLTITGRRAAIAGFALRHFPKLTRAITAHAIGRAYVGPGEIQFGSATPKHGRRA